MKMSSFVLLALPLVLHSISTASARACGLIFRNASIYSASYLTSPNYPSNYPPSLTCQWTITAPPGYVVELNFIIFDTEGTLWYDTGCSGFSDTLEVYNGRNVSASQLLGKYCKDYLPPNVYSSGTALFLKFESDFFRERKGFKIKFKAVLPEPDPTICSPFNTHSQNNAIKYSGSSGYIKSPLYGTKYPSNIQCTWIITVPEGKKVKLSFHDFEFVKIKYCSSAKDDYLEIRDGRYSFSSILKTLCSKSTTTHSSIDSTGRYMWIRFKSNTDNYITTNTAGFKIKYEAESTKINTVGIIVSVSVATVAIIVLVVVCVCIAKQKKNSKSSKYAKPNDMNTQL